MKYKPGDRVRVSSRTAIGHCRTPAYIRGKTGWVEALCGEFRNPESRAYGGNGLPEKPLYMVRFQQHEVWDRYGASPRDTLYVDLYEHWLEPA